VEENEQRQKQEQRQKKCGFFSFDKSEEQAAILQVEVTSILEDGHLLSYQVL
jgi:hypothetical protein